jgi:phosphate transport system permease protein
VFRSDARLAAWAAVALVFYVVWNIAPGVSAGTTRRPSTNGTGLGRNKAQFGSLPAIVERSTPRSSVSHRSAFGIAIAIFLAGFLASGLDAVLKGLGLADRPGWTALPAGRGLLKTTVELLAAVPSVVYGLWGIFVVIPLVREPANWLHAHLGWLPFFDTALSGPGILPASLVLAIMVLPTISAVSRDALVEVPPKLREAAFGLGATRWEVILAVIVPTASTGILGGVILGFGRALGETMALAMLAGNANVMSWSMFSPANTLAALLANHFPEAGAVEVGALMYAALVLLAITLVVNVVGTAIVQRADAALKGLR